MSQTKAQLVNPLNGDVGNKIVVGSAVTVTVDGINAAAGVITASSFSGSGAGLSGVGTANVSTSTLTVAGFTSFRGNLSIGEPAGIVIGPLNGANFTVGGATGIVTATTFVGDLTGDVTGNVTGTSGGLSGAPSIVVTNLTVNGTETIINTNELNVRDKTVGIGSTTTPTSTTQDGAGIIIYGQTQVDLLYDNDKAAVGLNTALSISGFSTVGGGISVGGGVNVGTGDVTVTTGDINVGSAATLYGTTGNATLSGIVTASRFDGPINIPAGQTGTVSLAASDAGKHVSATGTVTLGTSVFAVGDAVTIFNNTGGSITITLTAVTCYHAADGTTGNRTLGARGLASILCLAANTYVISGSGLS